jgi:hypothetical protein
MRPGLPDPHDLSEQYEALRREAIEADSFGRRGLGLALFLSRGMASWLTALTALVPRPPRSAAVPESPRSQRVPTLAPGLRSDLTTMLADMVLACSEEVAR